MSSNRRARGLKVLDWFAQWECYLEDDKDLFEPWSADVLDYGNNFDVLMYDTQTRFFVLRPTLEMYKHLCDTMERMPVRPRCVELCRDDKVALYRLPRQGKMEEYPPEIIDFVPLQDILSERSHYISLLESPSKDSE